MVHPIPQSPDEFTPELLTALLREADPDVPRVRSLVVEPMATYAITATLARVRATYDVSSEPHPPESFVWKRSLDDSNGRMSFLRGYRNEVAFYRDIAPLARTRVPTCYYADLDEQTGTHILLLEDVDGAHTSDTKSGATVEQARAFLHEIGRLHGAYWGRQTTSYFANTEAYVEFYRSMLDPGLAYLEPYLDTELRGVGAKVSDHLARWMTRLAGRPQTIVHGDAHGGNVLFTAGGLSECVILDWQGWHGDAGMRDVSRFLTLSLATPVRRSAEEALLDTYVDALAADGVSYPLPEARGDYWIGVAMQWVWAATFIRHEPLWTDELRALMHALVPRALEGLRDAAAAGVFE